MISLSTELNYRNALVCMLKEEPKKFYIFNEPYETSKKYYAKINELYVCNEEKKT
jgi:hypothetical protein